MNKFGKESSQKMQEIIPAASYVYYRLPWSCVSTLYGIILPRKTGNLIFYVMCTRRKLLAIFFVSLFCCLPKKIRFFLKTRIPSNINSHVYARSIFTCVLKFLLQLFIFRFPHLHSLIAIKTGNIDL